MEKRTVIANLRAEIVLSDEMQRFLESFEGQSNAWFAHQGGNAFLGEFGGYWNSIFLESVRSIIDEYFLSLGLPEDRLPEVEIIDSRRGSWIIDAVIAMAGTVGATYAILKAYADLPKVADGLEETTNRIKKELSEIFKKKVPERIEPILSGALVAPANLPPSVRKNPTSVTFSIDARPLRGLTPDIAKSHAIHLAVAVSRTALSVENLGGEVIENLRIGLFKSSIQKHSWNFEDAFSKSVPRLSGKQSISLSIGEFFSVSSGAELALDDLAPIYVDCWLQDNAGIFLFNFYVE